MGGREAVPTLAELFDAFPDASFNIDLKSEGAVPALADFIAARDAWDRVLVGSFSRRRTARFRELTGGRVPTSATPARSPPSGCCPSGRLAGLRSPARVRAALQIPHRRGRLVVATPGLVRRAHAAGRQVHVWTVDDADEMRVLLDRGVDGLFTDRTDILKASSSWSGDQWREPS